MTRTPLIIFLGCLGLASNAVGAHTVLGRASARGPASAPIDAFRVAGQADSSLRLVAERLSTPPSSSVTLDGLELLPIEVSGATRLHRFAAGRPRSVILDAGLTAIEWPGPGRVRLLHYRRAGGTIFGFIRLASGGRATVLMERAGIDAGNQTDPFDTVVGASSTGSIVLSAPTFSHGVGGYGECWLFPATENPPGLWTGVELTGPALLDVAGVSLTFKDEWLYAVMEDRLVRAPADGSALFATVPLPPSGGMANPLVIDELALSADGSTLAVLAGVDEDFVDLYIIDAAGTPTNLTNAPAKIEPPGYLPLETAGPFLALNEDGSWVAYVDEVPLQGGELYMQATAVPGAAEHVTSDPFFDHSIDNVSGIFGSGRSFLFFADSGLNNADLYLSTAQVGGGLLRENLTRTSASAGPFFPNAGQINVAAAWQLGEQRVIVDDRTALGAGYEFTAVTSAGSPLVAVGLDRLPAVSRSLLGDTWIASLHSPAASALLCFDGTSASPGLPLLLPGSAVLDEISLNSSGSVAALVVSTVPGQSRVVTLDLATSAVALVGGGWFSSARNLLFSGNRDLLFSAGAPAGTTSYVANLPTGALGVAGPAEPVSFWLR